MLVINYDNTRLELVNQLNLLMVNCIQCLSCILMYLDFHGKGQSMKGHNV